MFSHGLGNNVAKMLSKEFNSAKGKWSNLTHCWNHHRTLKKKKSCIVSEFPEVREFTFLKNILGDTDDDSGLTNTRCP